MPSLSLKLSQIKVAIVFHIFLFPCPGVIWSQEKIETEGAIVIQNSTGNNPKPGTIRWTGSDFQGWNGLRWASLTGNNTVASVTDIDGNVYQTISIGSYEWMVENLHVTKYNDNTLIPQITDDPTWSGLTTGAWCWYNNDSSFDIPYGKLYNWYAVNTGKLCPTGWRVPSNTEWNNLFDFLGGLGISGGKMKELGTIHWNSPNTGATNDSAFTGLPGGDRFAFGTFRNLRDYGNWWSSSHSPPLAWFHQLYYLNDDVLSTQVDKYVGYSVRCVRD